MCALSTDLFEKLVFLSLWAFYVSCLFCVEFDGISEKWDRRLETIGWTRDPRPGTHHTGETRDRRGETQHTRPETHFMGGTRDPRPMILKMGPDTQDPGPLLYTGPKTWSPGHWKRDLIHLWQVKSKINISCRTLDTRTMIYVNLIKCPINSICIMIFLILNHILKWLQHL